MNAIEVEDVSKRFRLYKDRPGSVKQLFTKFGRPKYEDFWAVRNVTLDVGHASVAGLIGHNGCGKSTLLRMMAGIHFRLPEPSRPPDGSLLCSNWARDFILNSRVERTSISMLRFWG